MKHTKYHFIGIGGIGMSALAHMLLQKGMEVTGSDIADSERIQKLRKYGAQIQLSHHADHVKPSYIVIYSSAIAHDNPELMRAKELGCILWHRADLLRWVARNQKPLVVAGTHGKTTTTAMLAHVLYVAGRNPSYVFGGTSPSFNSNGYYGFGEYFAIEGDESDGSFLKTDPFGAIITNIDDDHLDFWQSKEALYHAYVSFMLKVTDKNLLFWCMDDPFLSSLKPRGTSYGFSEQADIHIQNFHYENNRSRFDLQFKDGLYSGIDLGLLGQHNVYNATAVFAFCLQLGIEEKDIRLSFSSFKGVNRRLEKKGKYNGADVYDDYAHHPTEINYTLKTLRLLNKNKRLCAIFQPHRYTRFQSMMERFSDSLSLADCVIVTDIDGAGETPIEGINSETFYKTIAKQQGKDVIYVKSDQLESYLRSAIQANDVVVTLGAGNITSISKKLVSNS